MPTKRAQVGTKVTNLVKGREGREGEGRERKGREREANATRDVGGAWKAHHHKEKNTTLCVPNLTLLTRSLPARSTLSLFLRRPKSEAGGWALVTTGRRFPLIKPSISNNSSQATQFRG